MGSGTVGGGAEAVCVGDDEVIWWLGMGMRTWV